MRWCTSCTDKQEGSVTAVKVRLDKFHLCQSFFWEQQQPSSISEIRDASPPCVSPCPPSSSLLPASPCRGVGDLCFQPKAHSQGVLLLRRMKDRMWFLLRSLLPYDFRTYQAWSRRTRTGRRTASWASASGTPLLATPPTPGSSTTGMPGSTSFCSIQLCCSLN